MRLFLRLLRVLVSGAFVVVVVVNLAFGVLPLTGAVRAASELTGSMTPTIQVGGLVVYRPTLASKLHRGDVISFIWPGEPAPVTHRIVRFEETKRTVVLATRGDANKSNDPREAIFKPRQTVWRAVAVLPAWLGRPITDIGRRGLFFALGLIPLAVLLPWLQGSLGDAAPRAPRRRRRLRALRSLR